MAGIVSGICSLISGALRKRLSRNRPFRLDANADTDSTCFCAGMMAFVHGLIPGFFEMGASDLVKKLAAGRGPDRQIVWSRLVLQVPILSGGSD
jgi:hypothetical protein